MNTILKQKSTYFKAALSLNAILFQIEVWSIIYNMAIDLSTSNNFSRVVAKDNQTPEQMSIKQRTPKYKLGRT